MTDNVTPLFSKEKTAEELLEDCKNSFTDFVIMGYDAEGNQLVACTSGISSGPELLWQVELFKMGLMAGVFSE